MWTFNDINQCGTKHFRGLSTDPDITKEECLRLSRIKLRNGDEEYYMDNTSDVKVKIYDEENDIWIPQ